MNKMVIQKGLNSYNPLSNATLEIQHSLSALKWIPSVNSVACRIIQKLKVVLRKETIDYWFKVMLDPEMKADSTFDGTGEKFGMSLA